MAKIDLKERFSIKIDFRGGRPLYAYTGLVTGPALGRAQGLNSGDRTLIDR